MWSHPNIIRYSFKKRRVSISSESFFMGIFVRKWWKTGWDSNFAEGKKNEIFSHQRILGANFPAVKRTFSDRFTPFWYPVQVLFWWGLRSRYYLWSAPRAFRSHASNQKLILNNSPASWLGSMFLRKKDEDWWWHF